MVKETTQILVNVTSLCLEVFLIKSKKKLQYHFLRFCEITQIPLVFLVVTFIFLVGSIRVRLKKY